MRREIRFFFVNCGRKVKDIEWYIKGLLFLAVVLRGIIQEYRAEGRFHFDFETEWSLRLIGRPILDIVYNDMLVARRLIFRFENGWGAVVTVCGNIMGTNYFQEINFPLNDAVWFEVKSDKQHRWRISELCDMLLAVKNRDALETDKGYEERVPREERVYPMQWVNTCGRK